MGGISYIANVLNQKGAPAIFEDTAANRPTAGFTGRIFISTDTFVIQRDNGTTWDSLSAGITGSATTGQVTFWGTATTLSGDNTFFWDNTNKRLGLGTITPGVRLDIHGTGVIQQINGTTTNNAYLDFQNAGSTQWRLGNFYNGAQQQFALFNAAGATNVFTILQSGVSSFSNSGSFNGNLAIYNANQLEIYSSANSNYATIKSVAGNIQIGTNGGTTALTISTGQISSFISNVGIGYTPAITGLAVAGSVYQGSNVANSNFQMLCAGNFYTGGFTPNFSTYTSNITIAVGSNLNTGYVFKTAATITVNLPSANGLNNQFYFVVLTGTTVTVNRAGSDVIINTVGTSVTSLTLVGYTKVMLYCDGGTTWYQLF